jgi:hypothetical protein
MGNDYEWRYSVWAEHIGCHIIISFPGLVEAIIYIAEIDNIRKSSLHQKVLKRIGC